MALARYSDPFWYPDGTRAADVEAYVFGRFTRTPAPLFTDATGTTPITNPMRTDTTGRMTFFVEPGDYWIYIAGQSFPIVVDLDVEAVQVWASTFFYMHDEPETVWTINHGLLAKPAVTVLVDGQITSGDVQYLDDNTLTISFGSPTSGEAWLRR